MATLVILRDGEIDAEIPLLGNVRVGRDAQNDVVLEDASRGVSRFHAEIRATATGYSIVDLNSRNGVWLNGRKVHDAALTVGVPVTLGGYELMIEDRPVTDGFATSEASQLATIVNRDAGDADSRRPSGSSTRTADVPAKSNRAFVWLTCAAVALMASAVAFYFVRTREHTTPPIAATDVPPAVAPVPTAAPVPAAPAVTTAPDLPSDKTPDVAPASVEIPPPPAPVPRPPKPDETLVGRPLPNETAVEHQARSRRIRANYDSAKASLSRKDYRQAVSFLTLVQADQPKYLDTDALMTEALDGRQAVAKEALEKGKDAERNNDLLESLHWYERSAENEGTPELRDHIKQLRDRITANGNDAFRRAKIYDALGEKSKAIPLFQQAVDWLPEGNPDRNDALRRLEALKK